MMKTVAQNVKTEAVPARPCRQVCVAEALHSGGTRKRCVRVESGLLEEVRAPTDLAVCLAVDRQGVGGRGQGVGRRSKQPGPTAKVLLASWRSEKKSRATHQKEFFSEELFQTHACPSRGQRGTSR